MSRRGSDLVLTYHRIASGRDPLEQCVSPESFNAQLEVLRRLAEVVPLEELDRPARDTRVALTFDDGYRDNAVVAAPILYDAGLPATFFVSSAMIEGRGEYWWDRLEHIHLDEEPGTTTLELEIERRRLRVDVRSEAGRLRSLKALNRRLRGLALAEIDPLVEHVRVQLGVSPPAACDRHSLMRADDVARLAAHPLFEIGSHGSTHVMLSALPANLQREEIVASRAALERVTGRTVTSLAYPYGTDTSFDRSTESLVREAGYLRAFANTPLLHGRAAFRRPRTMVYDWSSDEFSSRLRGILAST
jgi:peptidoglycan/xylan/chitin deacetylase (PgdA/CDA1 family)